MLTVRVVGELVGSHPRHQNPLLAGLTAGAISCDDPPK